MKVSTLIWLDIENSVWSEPVVVEGGKNIELIQQALTAAGLLF